MATILDSVSHPIETKTIKHGDNTYTIENMYQQGHFGRVYKCSKNNTCEKFAIKQIKIINNDPSTLSRIVEEFKREYHLLDSLKPKCQNNPIVCIIEHFEHDNNYYIVMEDLFSLGYDEIIVISKEPYEIKLKIMNKLCESLIQLHSIKDDKENILVHRDIKTDNIMYKVDEHKNISIKFIDFGDACFECSTLPTGTILMMDPYLTDKILDVLDGRLNKSTKFITTCDPNATGDEQYCYQGSDIYSMGLIFIAIVSNKDWNNYINGLNKIFENINSNPKYNLGKKLLVTNMVKRFFIENFVFIENAIKECYIKNKNLYNMSRSDDEHYSKLKCILDEIRKRLGFLHQHHISFVDIDNEIKDIINENNYNIKLLIPLVLDFKSFLSRLDYDVNFFSLPMNKRYIKKKYPNILVKVYLNFHLHLHLHQKNVRLRVHLLCHLLGHLLGHLLKNLILVHLKPQNILVEKEKQKHIKNQNILVEKEKHKKIKNEYITSNYTSLQHLLFI